MAELQANSSGVMKKYMNDRREKQNLIDVTLLGDEQEIEELEKVLTSEKKNGVSTGPNIDYVTMDDLKEILKKFKEDRS